MKCIVTGGLGFIGSTLTDKLIDQGHKVTVIDDMSADTHEHFYFNKLADTVVESVQNYDRIREHFNGIDVVFHLAAESRIQPCVENPMAAVVANALGTCSVLQAARSAGVKRVIYSSTSASYGEANTAPFNELMCVDCLNPYSITKVAGEQLAKIYYRLYGLETVTFRYFNVYGERQPLKGQYAPVVGLFDVQHARGLPMTIVGDGLQTRDFTYVGDVVDANILAATVSDQRMFGEVFNIGTGNSISVMDLAEMIGGKDPYIKYIPERPGELRHAKADNSKAREILGWEPKTKIQDWINEQK